MIGTGSRRFSFLMIKSAYAIVRSGTRGTGSDSVPCSLSPFPRDSRVDAGFEQQIRLAFTPEDCFSSGLIRRVELP